MLTRKIHIIPDRLATEDAVPYPEREQPLIDKFQLSKLEVGQSFMICYRPNTQKREQHKVQMAIGAMLYEAHRQLPQRRFSQRSNRDGVRIWRIK